MPRSLRILLASTQLLDRGGGRGACGGWRGLGGGGERERRRGLSVARIRRIMRCPPGLPSHAVEAAKISGRTIVLNSGVDDSQGHCPYPIISRSDRMRA